ncbi:MAG TPA: transposase [Armatimonadota bacterium]|jgi:hypothetical protein
MIVPYLLRIFTSWQAAFATEHTGLRALRHALAVIASLGRGTITAVLCTLRLTGPNWHKEYRLYTHRRWSSRALFDVLLAEALPLCPTDYVVAGLDDTSLPKTGKRIPGVTYGRDPQSPAFHVNLRRQLRFIHVALLLPLYHAGATAARALPLRFEHAPPAPKLRKDATPEEQAAYKALHAARRLPAVGWDLVHNLRATLDALGQTAKTLLMVVDGSYCTRLFFRAVLLRVEVLARCRKNQRLCRRHTGGGRRFYSVDTFTPDAVRQDDTQPWHDGWFWFGGARRWLRYKEVRDVYWRAGGGRRTVRLLVLAPTGYRLQRRSQLLYRDPAYLLTTDLTAPAEFLMQSYLDRWQIEVAHRDGKTLLGVGEAQVRHPQAVSRQPAFVMAVYGALLLAPLLAAADERPVFYHPTPAWYDGPLRPSLEDIRRVVREELLEHPAWIAPYGVYFEAEHLVLTAAA